MKQFLRSTLHERFNHAIISKLTHYITNHRNWPVLGSKSFQWVTVKTIQGCLQLVNSNHLINVLHLNFISWNRAYLHRISRYDKSAPLTFI